MSKKKQSARPKFIPAIREMIVKNCPIHPDAANEAIDRWEAGEEPRHPLDRAVYSVCDKVRADIDAKA